MFFITIGGISVIEGRPSDAAEAEVAGGFVARAGKRPSAALFPTPAGGAQSASA